MEEQEIPTWRLDPYLFDLHIWSSYTTTGSRGALQQCSKCSNVLLAVSDNTTSPFSWSMRCLLNHNLTMGQRFQVRDPRILSLPQYFPKWLLRVALYDYSVITRIISSNDLAD